MREWKNSLEKKFGAWEFSCRSILKNSDLAWRKINFSLKEIQALNSVTCATRIYAEAYKYDGSVKAFFIQEMMW